MNNKYHENNISNYNKKILILSCILCVGGILYYIRRISYFRTDGPDEEAHRNLTAVRCDIDLMIGKKSNPAEWTKDFYFFSRNKTVTGRLTFNGTNAVRERTQRS